MKIRIGTQLMMALLAASLMVSCGSSRHYERSDSVADRLYGEQEGDSTQNLANLSWQELFNDSILVHLIDEGLEHNYDMQNAIAGVDQAESYFKQSRAAQWPTLSAGVSYRRIGLADTPTFPLDNFDTFSLGVSASWEVDIWGKMRTAKRAAYAQYLGTSAARQAVQTKLISSIASGYYTLLALDKQLKIAEESVRVYQELSQSMETLKESGMVTGAAVVQSEAAQYAAQILIPELKQQIVVTESTVRILLGRTEGSIERSEIDQQKANDFIASGVPLQLLDRRPDVMQAEYAVMASYEMVGNAKSYFYPSLTLVANNAGFNRSIIEEWFNPASLTATVLGGLTAPIFNKRANRTRLEVAKSQQEVAVNNFKSSLLNAGKEVTDALSQYDHVSQKIELRTHQLEALNKSVDYTRELLVYGSATYTEVLDAQQNLLNAQLNDVNDQLQKLSTVVSLYKALGGGWTSDAE
ncbi:MAG: efflux transporter outer membrane subunit [Mangrovibacterium sp.]